MPNSTDANSADSNNIASNHAVSNCADTELTDNESNVIEEDSKLPEKQQMFLPNFLRNLPRATWNWRQRKQQRLRMRTAF